MMQLLGDHQDGALELQIVNAEGQRGGQNLDEQLRAVGRLSRHEHPVIADRPDFALDSVEGTEVFCEGGTKFGHSWQVTSTFPNGKGLFARLPSNPLV